MRRHRARSRPRGASSPTRTTPPRRPTRCRRSSSTTAFVGNNGTLVVNRGGLELLPETTEAEDGSRRYRMEAIPSYEPPRDVDALDLHSRNFVEAIRKNDPSILACGIETGSLAAVNAHMGNIAFKVGRKVHWDAAPGSFRNDAEANALVAPPYHNGWTRPKV